MLRKVNCYTVRALLDTELVAWQNTTDNDQRPFRWHFTTSDARTRLRHL